MENTAWKFNCNSNPFSFHLKLFYVAHTNKNTCTYACTHAHTHNHIFRCRGLIVVERIAQTNKPLSHRKH